jgi:hypothetical protein
MAAAKPTDVSTPAAFSVKEIEKTTPPTGAGGSNWYRYEIASARSTITGYSRGTLQEVTRHAKAFAADLNSRAGGTGRSPWAPRKK